MSFSDTIKQVHTHRRQVIVSFRVVLKNAEFSHLPKWSFKKMCLIWGSKKMEKKFSNTRIVAEQAGKVWFGTDWAHHTNIWTTLKIVAYT